MELAGDSTMVGFIAALSVSALLAKLAKSFIWFLGNGRPDWSIGPDFDEVAYGQVTAAWRRDLGEHGWLADLSRNIGPQWNEARRKARARIAAEIAQNDSLRRVCWRVLATDMTGRGNPIPQVSANAWVEKMSAEHPGMEHWTEAA